MVPLSTTTTTEQKAPVLLRAKTVADSPSPVLRGEGRRDGVLNVLPIRIFNVRISDFGVASASYHSVNRHWFTGIDLGQLALLLGADTSFQRDPKLTAFTGLG